MVKIGGEYYRTWPTAEPWMNERWKRWIEQDIERAWQWERWGIETRDGNLTWQIILLAILLAIALPLSG